MLDKAFVTLGSIFILSQWPFFWSQVMYAQEIGGINLNGLLALSVILVSLGYRFRINAFLITVIFFLLIASLHGIKLVYLVFLLVTVAFSAAPKEQLIQLSRIVTWGFIVISLPSIILMLAFLFRIDLPFVEVPLGNRIQHLYPFGVLMQNLTYPVGDGLLIRIQGFTEEPGLVGTYAVFLLVLNHYTVKSKAVSVCLHVLGTLSFSTFYYACATIMLMVGITMKRREIVVGILAGALAFSALLSISLIKTGQVEPVLSPATRIFAEGNNRAQFDEQMTQQAGTTNLNALMIGEGSSNTNLVGWSAVFYEHGLIGLLIVLGFFAYLGRSFDPMLLPAMLAFYQRQDFLIPLVMLMWVMVARSMQPAMVSVPHQTEPSLHHS